MRREDRTSISSHLSQTSAGSISFSRRNGWPCLESSTTSQHGPRDACEPVGERDSEDVAVLSLLGRFDAALEPMTLPALRFDQHHPGSLYEQNAQIAVATLRYLAEDSAVAGRDLLRHEAQRCGEVATFRERVASTDSGHNSAGDDRSVARNAHQSLTAGIQASGPESWWPPPMMCRCR